MAYECLDVEATQKDLAALVGVSQPAIHRLVANGVLPRGKTLREWLLLWGAHFRAQASGRGGSASVQDSLTEARIRESNAKAMKAEVEVGERLGELVSITDLEPRLRDWALRSQQAIEGAGERIVDGIESEFGISLDDKHVREHLYATLRDIGSYPEKRSEPDIEDRASLLAARTGTNG